MPAFVAPWLLCLVFGSVVATSVEVDVPVRPTSGNEDELYKPDSHLGTSTTGLVRALTQCSSQVVTLSNLVSDIARHHCTSGSSESDHPGSCDHSGGYSGVEGSGFPPVDCHDHLLLGHNTSGVYEIHPSRCERSLKIRVYCDMETAGGGWTVFLMRKEQTVQENFTRTWVEYSRGFGDPTNEHWLGNDVLHALTSRRYYVLRADMEDFEGSQRWAEYDSFAVGSRGSLYPLTVSGYKGDAGDDMKAHNGQKFSTEENDNDSHSSNCAKTYKGGWWYGGCHATNPTGLYLKGEHKTYAVGVNWKSFKGYHYSLKTLSLKIRPRACANIIHHSL